MGTTDARSAALRPGGLVPVAALSRRVPLWGWSAAALTGTAALGAGVLAQGGPGRGLALGFLFAVAVVQATSFPRLLGALHVALVLAVAGASLGGTTGVDAGDLVLVLAALAAVAAAVHLRARDGAAAGVDPLTGVADRVALTRRLERTLAASAVTADPVTFVVLGLDRFALVNDARGRAAGDVLLREVAGTWAAAAPSGAVLGRWAGDQFAVVLRGDADTAWRLVEDLRRTLPEGLTCSAGVAAAEPGDEAEEAVDHADGALAQAKRTRRGSSHLWAPGTPTGRGLLTALEHGAVEVHYQPVVDLRTGAVTGAEALVRWRRPDGSLIPPADFLPQAEVSGTVVQLGRHVLRRACADAATWPAAPGCRPLSVAVNASGQELEDPGYAGWALAALSSARLPGSRLVIEVVEGLLDEESPVVADNLHALRAAGVRLAVDDFGTGWSSLSRLGRLPLDVLKIDRSFVATVEPGREAPVCAGVVALARALGLAIVAEGVETAHQADWLRGLGCEEAQGWLWAPALPAAAFRERVTAAGSGVAREPAVDPV